MGTSCNACGKLASFIITQTKKFIQKKKQQKKNKIVLHVINKIFYVRLLLYGGGK